MIASLDGIDLRAAAREVDHVHAVANRGFERRDDLGRVAHVTHGRGDVEDPVAADLRTRRHTGQAACLRMVRACRCGRSGIAGCDSRDVGSMEGGLRVERQPGLVVRADADEGARHDHLRRRPLPPALREPRRVAEALRREESVRRIDAVVDDRDLHSFAARSAQAARGPGADQTRTAVEREGVAVARVELARKREFRRPRQLGRR